MAYLGIFMFGVISLNRLSQELFPPITYPQLSIVTPYENAAPEEIETLITKPIEEAVGGIAGLRKVSSTSREGLSLVMVEFGWNESMDFASLAVREKIDLIKERLPRDAAEPVVIKFNPFELPVMSISVSSDERTPVQLKELAKKWFKDEIEKIQGVASASISGGSEEEILVDVDQAKMRSAGVSINEVSDAISSANLNYPGGTIKESFYEYLVRTLGEFKHIDEIGQIPVRRDDWEQKKREKMGPAAYLPPDKEHPSNRLVLLKDMATITRTVKERTSYSRFNGRENVTIAVQKQASGNAIKVADGIKKKLKELQERLPKDIHVDIIYDQSKFIGEALKGVTDAAIEGGYLSFLVLLIFLKDFKSSCLVVTIIPVTVFATFTLMYFMNISLNVISLGGVALGIGMLLDDAVVVMENVHRRYEKNPQEGIEKASIEGTMEVIGAMTASTLAAVAVFLPIIFVTGIAGQIFKQLAWVVVVTRLISMVIAFTLLPMLIAKVGLSVQGHLEGGASHPMVKKGWRAAIGNTTARILDFCGKPVDWLASFYNKLLPAFLKRKWFYQFLIFLVFCGSIYAMGQFDKVLLPKVDQGQFMVKADLPVGSRLEITNRVAKQIEKFVMSLPEVKHVSMVAGSSKGSSKDVVERLGPHQAQINVTLKDDRERSTDEIVQLVRRYFELGPGRTEVMPARVSYVLYDSAFAGGGDNDAPVVIDIKGPKLEEMHAMALAIQEGISKIHGVYGASNSLAEPFPETKIIINKDRASYYHLSVVSVANAANTAIKGLTVSKFKEESREVDIRVQLKSEDRNKLAKLGLLMIRSPLDIEVPLGDFVQFQTGKGPSEIKRESQERTVQVYAKVFKRSMKEINDEVEKVIRSTKVPAHYTVKLAGQSEEIKDSFNSLVFAFILSVILIYMIMASQFESLWQPFLVMFCVPLCAIGVALSLWAFHTPVSVVVFLGVILLGGIAVNNGIILIDYTNHLRKEGLSVKECVIRAGNIRLRPILMTAFASVFGVIPLAMGLHEGSALQAPMAQALMGGLLVSTFLSLVVVPSLYMGTAEFTEWLDGLKAKRRPPAPPKTTGPGSSEHA